MKKYWLLDIFLLFSCCVATTYANESGVQSFNAPLVDAMQTLIPLTKFMALSALLVGAGVGVAKNTLIPAIMGIFMSVGLFYIPSILLILDSENNPNFNTSPPIITTASAPAASSQTINIAQVESKQIAEVDKNFTPKQVAPSVIDVALNEKVKEAEKVVASVKSTVSTFDGSLFMQQLAITVGVFILIIFGLYLKIEVKPLQQFKNYLILKNKLKYLVINPENTELVELMNYMLHKKWTFITNNKYLNYTNIIENEIKKQTNNELQFN